MTLEQLFVERRQLFNRLSLVERAIKALQDVCGHNWVEDGHDSHKDYKKCTKCKKEDEE